MKLTEGKIIIIIIDTFINPFQYSTIQNTKFNFYNEKKNDR